MPTQLRNWVKRTIPDSDKTKSCRILSTNDINQIMLSRAEIALRSFFDLKWKFYIRLNYSVRSPLNLNNSNSDIRRSYSASTTALSAISYAR